jgi:small subunit ribosomal protein S6
MTKYEALYIISPELEEQAVKETIEKFSALITANGGSVE